MFEILARKLSPKPPGRFLLSACPGQEVQSFFLMTF
jgi:hypothetical protein